MLSYYLYKRFEETIDYPGQLFRSGVALGGKGLGHGREAGYIRKQGRRMGVHVLALALQQVNQQIRHIRLERDGHG